MAELQDEIREENSDMIALYYFSVIQEIPLDCEATSEIVDGIGWRGGWRIEDTHLDIFYSYGSGGGVESRFIRRLPIVYIIETATMRVIAGEKADEYDYYTGNMVLDILEEVRAINQNSP